MKGLSSEIASFGISGVHPPFALPVFRMVPGAVTVVASRVDPAEGWVQSRLLVGAVVSVASANRRRFERGLAATVARQVRFGAWFRTLVRAHSSRGGGRIWSAATCFRAGSAVQFSSFGERWLTALCGPSYLVAGGCSGGLSPLPA